MNKSRGPRSQNFGHNCVPLGLEHALLTGNEDRFCCCCRLYDSPQQGGVRVSQVKASLNFNYPPTLVVHLDVVLTWLPVHESRIVSSAIRFV